jgi:alkylated DNA nucleotide flippase Atl1
MRCPHRVVNRNETYRKFHFDGTNLMQQLLESEGIVVVDHQIVDFENTFGLRCNGTISALSMQLKLDL